MATHIVTITPETKNPKAAIENTIKIFLAGGISGCPDWQTDAIKGLQKRLEEDKTPEIILYNPRKGNWQREDGTGDALKKQILWEHTFLDAADMILFWFPAETVCPITLFELGKYAMKKPILVGCHAKYCRREDVILQLALIREDVSVCNNLEDLLDSVSQVVKSL